MKKLVPLMAALAAVMLWCPTSSAQTATSRSAYFLDGYDFRHWLNPAIASPRSYFSLPVLGNTSVTTQSNLGVGSLYYTDPDGDLVSFSDKSVRADEVLGNIRRNKNTTSLGVNTSLISIGAWGRNNRGFTTVDIGVKAGFSMNLPRDLFSYIKEANAGNRYDIGNLGFRINSYLQIAVGRSQRITENITVGAKFKFLIGLTDLSMKLDKLDVSLGEGEWLVSSQGSIRVSGGGFLSVPTYSETGSDEGDPDEIDLDGLKVRSCGLLGGYGAALDLGAVYDNLVDGLTLSASVLDLGFIRWKSSVYARTPDVGWSYPEDTDRSDINGSLVRLYREDGTGPYTRMLAATVLLAGEYRMPFYSNLSAGALVTTHIEGIYTWVEGRVSANLALGNWFGFSLSYALSNFGSSLGSAINFHCRGLNFFLGADTIPMKYTSAFKDDLGISIPSGKLNLNVNLGLAFNVSSRKDKSDFVSYR